MKRFGLALLVSGSVCALGLVVGLRAEPPREGADLTQLMKRAAVDGKYRMLLAQFKVENDAAVAGDFKDLGALTRSEYAGHMNLPKGYWVYAKPYWYIWRDLSNKNYPLRPWGPEQAAGEPNTETAGDIQTAWASQSQDDQDEWLMAEYAEPIVPVAVLVHETYNPGALVRVTAFKLDGTEVELWKGVDPTGPDNELGISEIPIKVTFPMNRLKIHIASREIPGWNEIDAIGIRDREGKMHWARSVEASSTYAPPFDAVPPPLPAPIPVNAYEQRIGRLEREITQLKALVEELRKKVEAKDKP